jgi:hypothetical protein
VVAPGAGSRQLSTVTCVVRAVVCWNADFIDTELL